MNGVSGARSNARGAEPVGRGTVAVRNRFPGLRAGPADGGSGRAGASEEDV